MAAFSSADRVNFNPLISLYAESPGCQLVDVIFRALAAGQIFLSAAMAAEADRNFSAEWGL
jgi:hypothetical protein